MSAHFDVVLVGSGISSLTCAAILAKKGKSVCVLEQYKKPGGYLHSFKRFGHTYETGAHYAGALAPGEPFHTLLTYIGVMDPELVVPLDETGFDVFHFPTFEFTFPKGYAALTEALCARFPHERAGLTQYLQMVSSVVQHFQTYHFRRDLNLGILLESLDASLEKIVSGLVQDPKARCVLYGHCYLHGVKPSDVSFGLHALMMDSIVRSPHGFPKGGDALAEKFVQKIKEHGGVVRLGASVKKLHVQGKRVTELELENGERLTATHYVSGAHPRTTLRLLDPNPLPPAVKMRFDRATESTAIFGIYAEAAGPLPLERLRNYYYFASEQPEKLLHLEDYADSPSVVFLSRPDRTAVREDLYPLIFHSPGPAAWFTEWNGSRLGKRPAEYAARKQELAGKVLNFVDARVPGLKNAIRRFESSTALTNLHFNRSEEGSGYGIYHSMDYTGIRALGPKTTRVENLLLTGQSTLTPGLLGAATSGLRTAGELVGLSGLLDELIELRDASRGT